MFSTDKNVLKKKELTRTLVTDTELVQITNLNEIIPTGKFKYLNFYIFSSNILIMNKSL